MIFDYYRVVVALVITSLISTSTKDRRSRRWAARGVSVQSRLLRSSYCGTLLCIVQNNKPLSIKREQFYCTTYKEYKPDVHSSHNILKSRHLPVWEEGGRSTRAALPRGDCVSLATNHEFKHARKVTGKCYRYGSATTTERDNTRGRNTQSKLESDPLENRTMSFLASLRRLSTRTASSVSFGQVGLSIKQRPLLFTLAPFNGGHQRSLLPATNIRLLSSPSFKKKKNAKPKPLSGAAGRIQMQQIEGKKRKSSSSPKLCSGCGVEVTKGESPMKLAAGEDALDPSRTKKQAKKARYMDPTDKTQSGDFLCQRCKALQSNNIWKAYDALRDVQPKVFLEQLRHIVSRRRFGLCIMVVDATDAEHTAVRNLRDAIRSTPTILVFNKIDLLPRISRHDQRLLRRKIESNSTRFIEHYAVSAETGAGLVALAQGILEKLGGRDIFVVGAANVGKSSLVKKLSTIIAESVYLKGRTKAAMKRREMTNRLKVTGSSLPGTTLQAVRVPCFPSPGHALWDTPGIINARALQYHIFPSHLMEPLTHPGEIEIPSRENGLAVSLRPGQSILIEATWMNKDDIEDENSEENSDSEEFHDSEEEPCVLGRIDLVKAVARVDARAYIHPSLRIRVVPTERAPSTATIPLSHIQRVKQRIGRATGQKVIGLEDSYSLPLQAFIQKNINPDGAFVTGEDVYNAHIGKFSMDVSLASLGWISFLDENKFSVIPQCVKGSIFSKRRSLYPANLAYLVEEYESEEHIPDVLDEETMRQLRKAADEGKHLSNTRRNGSEDHDYEMYDENEWF